MDASSRDAAGEDVGENAEEVAEEDFVWVVDPFAEIDEWN